MGWQADARTVDSEGWLLTVEKALDPELDCDLNIGGELEKCDISAAFRLG